MERTKTFTGAHLEEN